MSAINTRYQEIKNGINDFNRLMRLYAYSQKANGWADTETNVPIKDDTRISDFSLNEMGYETIATETTATLFDVPMNSKTYVDGCKCSGIPSDIGFTKNVGNYSWKKSPVEFPRTGFGVIQFLNDRFICTSSSDLFYSFDGINWTEIVTDYSDEPSFSWSYSCYGNGKYIIHNWSGSSVVVLYSTDGINWTESSTTLPDANWLGLEYGNDKYVMTARSSSSRTAYSTDGITWTVLSGEITARDWVPLVYGGGKFIVAACYDTYGAYSTDGITWTETIISDSNMKCWDSCYGNNKYVIIAHDSRSFSSVDGITWVESMITDLLKPYESICYGNGLYLTHPNESGSEFYYSRDGVQWLEGIMENCVHGAGSKGIAYGNSKFIAKSSGSPYIIYNDNNLNNLSFRNNLLNVVSNSTLYYKITNSATASVGGYVKCSMTDLNTNLSITINNESASYSISPPNGVFWNRNNKFLITSKSTSNSLRGLYCFLSCNKLEGGFILYISSDFFTWNVHQLIPGDASDDEWQKLLNSSDKIFNITTENASILNMVIAKYFRVLPNNNYLIMYPLSLYRGEDKLTMVTMYSPDSSEPLMRIIDPYITKEDYQDKAINGFSSYLDENGYLVLYYNNRLETPMILYNGRIMGTYKSSKYGNYNEELVECPKVGKYINTTYNQLLFSGGSIGIDCAISMAESTSGSLDESSIPAVSMTLNYGDVAKRKINSECIDGIGIHINKKIDMMDNIDLDYSSLIDILSVDGEQFRDGSVTCDTLTHIYNANCLQIILPDRITDRGNNMRYRATVFGNTLYNSSIKMVNNPSLGDFY